MKTFLALAWRRSTDGKIPLSSKNGGTDNGAIPKSDVGKEASEKPKKENMASCKSGDSNLSSPEKLIIDKDDDLCSPESKPMSLLRKFAMFVSLDIIALYFVALAWLIPCRLIPCNFGKEWTMNLDNVSIFTNLEVARPLSLGLLLFGYYGENIGDSNVIALMSSIGSVKWQISLDFRPLRCHCKVGDVNGDGVGDCLIFGSNNLLAINASDGHVFWNQDFRKISPLIAAAPDCDNKGDKWIATVESKGPLRDRVKSGNAKEQISIVILDSKNGSVVRDIPLQCDSFPKQLVTWKSNTNASWLAFQCSYNGRTEVKLISEEEICSLILDKNMPRMRDSSVLFSFGSSTAVDDVFLLPVSHEGLLVGWSTMVAIATDARNRPRLLWQTMSGSIRSAIKFLSAGYFTSKNSMQIAVVLSDGSSSVVKIVSVPDGKEMTSIDLGSRRVTSVLPISGKKENADSLLIVKEGESSGASRHHTDADVIDSFTESTYTEDMLRQAKTYLLLAVGKENNVTELLTEKRRTEVIVVDDDCTTLFIATLMSNHTTSISSRALTDSSNTCSCR